MAKSIVIPIIKKVTVSGTSNLLQLDTTIANAFLRRFDDAGVYAEEIVGVSLGDANFQFDIPEGNYQLWKAAYPDATAGNRLDFWHGGAGKYRRIQDEADAKYIRRDNSQPPTAHISFGNYRLFDVADPASGVDIGDRAYNDARYVLLSAYADLIPSNCLFVSNGFSEIAGKRYQTPQAAINYATSLTPSKMEYWKIFIFPHTNIETGYTGGLTCQQSIKLIGMGNVKISGAVSGFSQYSAFENIMFMHSGNMTFNNSAVFKNCSARLTGTSAVAITIDTIIGLEFNLFKNGNAQSIVSNGNNNWGGYSNFQIAFADTDNAHLKFINVSDFEKGSEPA